MIDGAATGMRGIGGRCALEIETSGISRKAGIEMLQIRQVLPAVQGRDRAVRHVVEEREMELVDMEVQDVELRTRSRRTLSSISM